MMKKVQGMRKKRRQNGGDLRNHLQNGANKGVPDPGHFSRDNLHVHIRPM